MLVTMPSFGSMDDLMNYMNGTVAGASTMSKEIYYILSSEAKRLEKMIQARIDRYYSSYIPKKYIRREDRGLSDNWRNSLRVSRPKIGSDGMPFIHIYFDEMSSYHHSVMYPPQPMGYVPWLMEVGWDITSKVSPPRAMFTHHPGTSYAGGVRYIRSAVEAFNMLNPYGLEVMVFVGNERYL